MQDFGGQKVHIIEETGAAAIFDALKARGITQAHFNNGTFMLPKEKFAPAFLAAFKRVTDLRDPVNGVNVPLVVAINSDKSMKDSYAGKDNEAALVENLVPQEERAANAASLLSSLYPDRSVAVVFYDEQTPHEIYSGLSKLGFGLKSLHKVGFGTSDKEKPIIGAEFFEWVFACPLPFDAKPVMYNDTRDALETDVRPNLVEKLTVVHGPHGAPYMIPDGTLLFSLPMELKYLGVRETRLGDAAPEFKR
ncbi:MAG: hypothetical protein DI626_09835 [Micavibrio aeruginosavorus]|uniref:Uncharacterized protein n=1 Tax=Micavibrio aeruginosavorus TaxID=349221 RepID=A0A2W5BI15_9BACT|nr:MAG: hypothetical protein DI626_09835 [Micavibrio aeruginosavorus]